MTSYTGRFFEVFAEQSDPNRFEATDIVAVSCLGIDVPEAVSAWLLLDDEGVAGTGALLQRIGGSRDCDLRTFDLATDSAALALWDLLSGQRDMGPTTVSKLMAAKRPQLVPIYDTCVADAVLRPGTGRWRWWQPWQDLMRGPEAEQLVEAAEKVRNAAKTVAPRVEQLSVLRIRALLTYP